jgi:septin family protein
MITTKNELLEEPVTILETHQLRTGYVHVRSDGIVYIRIYDDVEVDVEDSKEHYEIVKRVFNGVPGYVITESGLNSSVTKEVREFVNTIPVISKAEAIIVNSLAQRIMSNFIIKFHYSRDRNIKVFNSLDAAVEWIKKQ